VFDQKFGQRCSIKSLFKGIQSKEEVTFLKHHCPSGKTQEHLMIIGKIKLIRMKPIFAVGYEFAFR
jgi:hypothetical protein